MKKQVKAQYQIKAIELLESGLNTPDEPLAENSTFKFDINLEHRLNNEKKLIIVVSSINIKLEKNDVLYGHLKSSCVFNVLNWEEFNDSESEQLNFSPDFLSQLNSITISSARGLLFSTFRGTVLHNAILPIIDLSTFKVTKK